ncbi:MAG: aldo/keto reductase [Sedimentisphaeraceae bacterium JB056]
MKFDITRRDFLRTVSAASITAAAAGNVFAEDGEKAAKAEAKESSKKDSRYPEVPRRTLGKTGITVPILSLGAMYNVIDNQVGLRKTLAHNANYWDTAHSYAGGNSEIGIGKFFEKYPEKREQVIIATKASGAKTSEDRDSRLATSFERMNTDYVDIYYGVHGMSSPEQLTDELKQWAAKAKEEGKIKFFGFTTHKNMTECLNAAAECDWIDVIMTSFNFRLLQDSAFMAAVDKCHKAGIGLVAMKVMTRGQSFESDDDKELRRDLNDPGLSVAQAKIKIVLEDERIASACIGMDTISKLNENIRVALEHEDKKLSEADKVAMARFANETQGSYCAACGKCSTVSQMPYTPEVMRYVMYYNNYGGAEDMAMARELYSQIPKSYRDMITGFDYSAAEASCPQGVRISSVIDEAARKLA